MYQQENGVAIGSPLGPALTNIFVGCHEERLFDCDQKPGVYFRYVDDTYTIFITEAECVKKPLLCRQKEFVFTLGLHW